MRRKHFALVGLSMQLLIAACAQAPPPGPSARPDRNVITRADFADRQFETAYDAVYALRRNWLANREVDDTFSKASERQVYLEDARFGGLEKLREIRASEIVSITYLDGIQAHARWGMGHDAGVLVVKRR